MYRLLVVLLLVNLNYLKDQNKIISFIARDESQHLAVSQRIINNFRDIERDKIMDKVIKDTDKEVYKMYDDAVQEEKDGRLIFFKRFYDRFIRKIITSICRVYGKTEE